MPLNPSLEKYQQPKVVLTPEEIEKAKKFGEEEALQKRAKMATELLRLERSEEETKRVSEFDEQARKSIKNPFRRAA